MVDNSGLFNALTAAQAQTIAAQAVADALNSANYQNASQVQSAINTTVPPPVTMPLFRVEAGPTLLSALNGVAWMQRVDRASGTQIAGSLTLSSLSLGTLTLAVRVNGATKATVTVSAAQANVEQTFTIAQALAQGDVLSIVVTGLGTTPGFLFGYLKAS